MRPRQNPADFLRDWGATTVQADLNDSTSLPAALVGIHTVIDCCTARPEESTQRIDWEGKVALIQCAQVKDNWHIKINAFVLPGQCGSWTQGDVDLAFQAGGSLKIPLDK